MCVGGSPHLQAELAESKTCRLASWQPDKERLACREEERLRIESQNPNPKAPLVRYVGGT